MTQSSPINGISADGCVDGVGTNSQDDNLERADTTTSRRVLDEDVNLLNTWQPVGLLGEEFFRRLFLSSLWIAISCVMGAGVLMVLLFSFILPVIFHD